MQTITVGVPHNGDFTPEFIVSLFNLLFSSKASCKLNLFESCLVHQARNSIFRGCKDDYLLFIDTDLAFSADSIERLLALDKDIVGGLYYSRKAPHLPLAFHLKDGRYHNIMEVPDKPFQCDSVATGFMLIKKKVIDAFRDQLKVKAENPFDFMRRDAEFELGEDMAFCKRAKDLGFEIWCDPTIELLHCSKTYARKELFESYVEVGKADGEIH
jgi:GT2 family glycosyltransferase